MSENVNTDSPAAEPTDTPSEGQATPPATEQPAAPDSYTIEYPEGHEVFEDVKTSFEDLVKNVGLNKEQAQKLVELGMNQSQQIIAAQEAKKAAEIASWADASKADKEIGGERFTENLSIAGKALEQFTTPEFKEMLNQTGIGNHPEVIRLFYKIGKQISEDGLVNSNRSNHNEAPTDPLRRMEHLAQQLYPNT